MQTNKIATKYSDRFYMPFHQHFIVSHRTACSCQKGLSINDVTALGGRVKQKCNSIAGVNLINILRAAFTHADPNSAKKTDSLTVFFELLGSTGVKAACKMLLKSTSEVSFGIHGVTLVSNLNFFKTCKIVL
jgi:hypothetical protein